MVLRFGGKGVDDSQAPSELRSLDRASGPPFLSPGPSGGRFCICSALSSGSSPRRPQNCPSRSAAARCVDWGNTRWLSTLHILKSASGSFHQCPRAPRSPLRGVWHPVGSGGDAVYVTTRPMTSCLSLAAAGGQPEAQPFPKRGQRSTQFFPSFGE